MEEGNTHLVTSGGVYTALAGKQDELTFDAAPVQGSSNPVTSGGVYQAIATAQGAVTIDEEPTEGSANPVSSGGVYQALQGVQPSVTMDAAPTEGSTNPVESGGIYTALHTLRASTEKTQVTLSAEWTGEGPYTQAVTISGTTTATKVDLQPDASVIAQMALDGVKALWIQNDNGSLTAVAVGGAPSVEMTLQCTLENIEGQSAYDSYPIADSTALVLSGGVYAALQAKQDTLTYDTAPTEGSTNPLTSGAVYTALSGVEGGIVDADPAEGSSNAVSSGGVYTALAGKQDSLTFDEAPTTGSTNPVTSGGVHSALALKQDALEYDTAPTYGSQKHLRSGAVFSALALKQGILTFDVAPTQGSNGVLSSGAVYDALQNVQPALTVDDEPTEGSTNLVTSGGVYTALSEMDSLLDMDTVPTMGSSSTVASGGVYSALAGKQDSAWTVYLTLPHDSWEGAGPYTQTVTIEGSTERSVVTLLPGHALIDWFRNNGVESLWVENNGGVLTAYVIGAIPSSSVSVPCMVMNVGSSYSSGSVAAVVDSELSSESQNPVQNQAVYAALQEVRALFDSLVNGDEVGY